MPYSYVKRSSNAANANTVAITPAQAGNMLIVVSSTSAGAGSPTASIADTNTNSWSTARATTAVNPAAMFATVFYAQNCKAGSTTITLTFNGGTPGTCEITVYEFSGLATSGAFFSDSGWNLQSSPGTGANAITSNALTVSSLAVPALGFCVSMDQNGNGLGTGGAGTGFTYIGTDGGILIAEHQRISVAGSNTGTFTTSNGTDIYATDLLVFSEPASNYSFVAENHAVNTGSGTGISTAAIPVQAGDLMVLCVQYGGANNLLNPASVSSTSGVFINMPQGMSFYDSTNSCWVSMHWVREVQNGSYVYSANFAGTVSNIRLSVAQYRANSPQLAFRGLDNALSGGVLTAVCHMNNQQGVTQATTITSGSTIVGSDGPAVVVSMCNEYTGASAVNPISPDNSKDATPWTGMGWCSYQDNNAPQSEVQTWQLASAETDAVTTGIMVFHFARPLVGLSTAQDMPLRRGRTPGLNEFNISPLGMTGIVPPFPPIVREFLMPIRRVLPLAVTAQQDQQQEVSSVLYGRDAVLVPVAWSYGWPEALERMPVALRSDSVGTFPGVVVVSSSQPVGAADQAYAGRQVRLPGYGYEFPMPLPIFGKDRMYGGPGQPLLNVEWPVPVGARRAASLSDFAPAMDALFTFVPARPPISQSDWPVPPGAVRRPQDFIQGMPLADIGYLVTYPPYPEFDTRVPRAAPIPRSFFEWEWWQQGTTTQYPPFINADWPVPPGARRPTLDFANFFQWGLLTPPAVLTFDWPNPQVPRRPYDVYTISHFFSRPLFTPTPPTNYDWPVPRTASQFIRSLAFDEGGSAIYLPAGTTGYVLTQLEVYQLVNAGLQPQVQWAYSPVPVDYVIATAPPAGTVLPVNTPVVVFSSMGPPSPGPMGQLVPNVVGLPASQAVSLLSASYMSIGTFTWVVDALIGSGVVLAQSVLPGTFANPGTIVNLTLSQGTAPPDYTAKTGTVN